MCAVRIRLVALALFAFGVLANGEAEACSCAERITVVPPDFAMDVPLNAKVVVSGLTISPTDAFVIRAGDDVVETAIDTGPSDDNTVTLVPTSPLAAFTRYSVEVQGLTWTFTTGDRIDTEAPDFSGLQEMTLEAVDAPGCATSTCLESGLYLHAEISHDEPEDDVAYFWLHLRNDDGSNPRALWLDRRTGETERILRKNFCSKPLPEFVPDTRYCAILVGYDLAGNSAGDEAEVCTDALMCEVSCTARGDHPEAGCAIAPIPEQADDEEQAGSSGCGLGGTSPLGVALLLLAILAVLAVRRREA